MTLPASAPPATRLALGTSGAAVLWAAVFALTALACVRVEPEPVVRRQWTLPSGRVLALHQDSVGQGMYGRTWWLEYRTELNVDKDNVRAELDAIWSEVKADAQRKPVSAVCISAADRAWHTQGNKYGFVFVKGGGRWACYRRGADGDEWAREPE